jgi:hypothetical protein
MKILAQSTVPTRPSYLHLGYLAAGTTYTERPYLGVALGLMLLGLVVMTKLRAVRTAKGLNIQPALRSRPVWIAGMLILVGGAAILYFEPTRERRDPLAYTDYVMRHVGPVAIVREWFDGKLSSGTDEALAKQFVGLEDGWSRKLRVRYANQNPDRYELRSAGPDGQFDTADDVARTVTPSKFEPTSRPENEAEIRPGS